MTTQIYEGPAIMIGYAYRLRLEAAGALFPEGAAFTGHVRAKLGDTEILATLTSANGGLERVSDSALDLQIAAADTAGMAVGSVVVDVVRTDTDPDRHLGFALEIPVMSPVTRGL
ncbi:hypothetical protein MED193_12618 [Roseobacter sp. MED193]|uniref:hypothetical protein n=1 Tax=Roseobacter sp. MED193 TaxID=314262 RepID=UPI000068E409|nr:hypothetical protein [Roseobacter sp. MED193]EAQ43713.1 hypothetical protein MED193_12618 [Roseobacter sp. MED193]